MRVFTGKLPQVIFWKNAVETMAFNCGKVMVLGVLVGPPCNDFTQKNRMCFKHRSSMSLMETPAPSRFGPRHPAIRCACYGPRARSPGPASWPSPGGSRRCQGVEIDPNSKDLRETREVGNISWHIPNSQLDAVGCWAKTCFQFSAVKSTNAHAIPASNGGSYRLTASSFSCDMVPAAAPGASGRSGSGQGPSGSSRHTSCNVSSKAQRTGSLIT